MKDRVNEIITINRSYLIQIHNIIYISTLVSNFINIVTIVVVFRYNANKISKCSYNAYTLYI